MLVDDEPDILATLGAILELHNLEVATASSAEGARRLLQSKCFDLVITDMKMESDTAGYKVVSRPPECGESPDAYHKRLFRARVRLEVPRSRCHAHKANRRA